MDQNQTPAQYEEETQRRIALLRARRRERTRKRRPTMNDFLSERRDRFDFEES